MSPHDSPWYAEVGTRPLTFLWLLAGAIMALSFGYTEMQGSDLWWHLAAGREILQVKTLWLVDDWSFTALGDDWHNHEWLSDIIFYAWSQIAGVESLVYWKWLLVVSTFLGLQFVLYRQSGSHVSAFICTAIAATLAAPFIDVRPHLYSLLNYSLLLLLLLNRRPPTWQLALLFFVWVNLHGGFFFGIMAAGILLFPWRSITLETVRGALLVGMICVMAALVSPSGIKSFMLPLNYAFDAASPYRSVGEWITPFRPGGIQSPYFIWILPAVPVVAFCYAIPAVRRKIDVPWEGLLLSGLALAMALTSRRFIPLFGMSFALVLAPLLGLLLRRLEQHRLGPGVAGAALVIAITRMLPYPLVAAPAYHYLTAAYSYPVDTLDFMQVNEVEGNVYALYNWGGYIHWRTDGGLKVFIDGRADTVFDAKTYLDYVDVLAHREGWREKIDQSGVDYVLWPLAGYGGAEKGNALLQTGKWKLVYQDSVSFLLARASTGKPVNYVLGPETPHRHLGVAKAALMRRDYDRVIEYAGKARGEIPYHQRACNMLHDAHTGRGDAAAARAVASDCRSHFPSAHLRQ